MDAGIADTLNRHVVQLITKQLDTVDMGMPISEIRWPTSAMADTLMGAGPDTSGDRAWLVGFLAARTPGVDFDGHPADCDWGNLFSHFRAEILSRRDPKLPSVRAAESPCEMV
jgi:hypothetical protein